MGMNSDQIVSIIRQILLAVGGFVVGKGWVDNDTMIQIAGALSVLVGSVWAIWSRTNKNIVASAAAKVPVPATSQQAAGISVPVQPTS
jgi:hypothetical protein